MVEILYSTGVRGFELRALKLGDIDLQNQTVTVRRGKVSSSQPSLVETVISLLLLLFPASGITTRAANIESRASKEVNMSNQSIASNVTLSHAIREGAKLKAQSPWERKHVGSSCALGAAADHIGCTIADGGDDKLLEFFPQLSDQVDAYEEFPAGTLRKLVCSLNNGGRNREQIADIVETLGY